MAFATMTNPVAAEAEAMEKELYIAAAKGYVHVLQKDKDYLLKKTQENNNILHIAIQYEQISFIEACFIKFTINELICERNTRGNNPLHVAAEVGNVRIVSVLYNYIEERIIEGGQNPWREQNFKGNTPLHVAIVNNNANIAKFLLEKDHFLASIPNKLKEAPLHLALRQHVNYTGSESTMARVQRPITEGGEIVIIEFAPQEDMSSTIKLLVEIASYVTCWPDAKGLTPLHRAASLTTPHNVDFTKFIIEHCPQAAEVCDSSGKSILHLLVNKIPNYQACQNLLTVDEIYALRNCQDNQGNTPLHIAAKNMDINMVLVLLESSVKFNINNMEGVSAASLIQEQNTLQIQQKPISMKKEEIEATDKANINFLREKVSKLGKDILLLRDSKGRNVLHKLMHINNESQIKHDDLKDFIRQVVTDYPSLVSQTDQNGDTPIHVLVRNSVYTTVYVASTDENNNTQQLGKLNLLPSMLDLLINQFALLNKQQAKDKGAHYDSPLTVQNGVGNTPLHEALIANNRQLVTELLKYDKSATAMVNRCKETPLHLLAGLKCPLGMEPYTRNEVESMMMANIEAASLIDRDCLTPILRAFLAGNLGTASILCRAFPNAAKIGDTNGQTYGHLLVTHPSPFYFSHLFQDDAALRELLEITDKNGNTPLHLAIEAQRFDLVLVFLETWETERFNKRQVKWLLDLLGLQNKGGKSPKDLIGELPYLPSKIEKKIMAKTEMFGVRSVWGIPFIEMKTYVSTIGIIAALLTTITFTAAFTVPGGLIQDKGTPILIGQRSFQVFIISDISAMCLSMMVLFILLWIMATNNRHNSVILLDFCILLLLASFFATLMTFMAGLYVTTFRVTPWIAIFTLVTCSLLMLLVHKFLVFKLLIPIGKATLIFITMFWQRVVAFCNKTTKCCMKIPNA